VDEIPYLGEVKRMTKATIEKLNNVGGLISMKLCSLKASF